VSLQFSSMSSQTASDGTGVDVGERLRAIQWIGMAAILVGMIAIALP